MEYAKLLQQSAGKFDYRESPLKTQMKVNELRKTIDKDGRANIIRQEPYANKIATYLSNEELKRKMNEGAMAYKRGVQGAYDDYQLEKLKNDPLKFVEKARKQTELMKLFNNPSQMEYLRKTDPIGLFYLEQAQDEEKQKDIAEQQQKREQQQQEAREKAVADETRRVKIAREQEEARQEGIRLAVVGPPLGELGQYFKGPRDVKVNEQGNLTINGQNVAIPIAVAQLQKFAPELTETMGAREIASRYRDSQIRQASERAGISLPQFKAELNRRKDAERMQRFLVTKEQEQESMDIGTLFDDEVPIAQQHAEELMADNPDLDPNEANREARDNIVDARHIAKKLYEGEPSTWEAEGESRPLDMPLLRMKMLPSIKILNTISTKGTLEKIAKRFRIPYNDSDSIDVLRQKLKDARRLQRSKRVETYGAEKEEIPEFIPLPEPTEGEELFFSQAPAKQEFVDFDSLPLDTRINELLGYHHIVRSLRQLRDYSEDLSKKEKQKKEQDLVEKRDELRKEFKQKYNRSIQNELQSYILRVQSEYEKRQSEFEKRYGKSYYADLPTMINRYIELGPEQLDGFNSERDTLRIMILGNVDEAEMDRINIERDKIGKSIQQSAPAPPAPPAPKNVYDNIPSDRKLKTLNLAQLKDEYVKIGRDPPKSNDTKAMINELKQLRTNFGTKTKGKGFRPLSSYPPHIIAGALHIVKQRKKLRTNQNEYNREQAKKLLNQVLKK